MHPRLQAQTQVCRPCVGPLPTLPRGQGMGPGQASCITPQPRWGAGREGCGPLWSEVCTGDPGWALRCQPAEGRSWLPCATPVTARPQPLPSFWCFVLFLTFYFHIISTLLRSFKFHMLCTQIPQLLKFYHNCFSIFSFFLCITFSLNHLRVGCKYNFPFS